MLPSALTLQVSNPCALPISVERMALAGFYEEEVCPLPPVLACRASSTPATLWLFSSLVNRSADDFRAKP